MASYRINRGDQTFVARDVAELKLWAASGKVFVDDLVQAQGTNRWEYAYEVKELAGLVKKRSAASLALDDAPSAPASTGVRKLVIALCFLGIVAAFGVVLKVFMNPPSPEQLLLTGDGPNALQDRDALLTQSASLRAQPSATAPEVEALVKDARVSLVSKSGEWYQVQSHAGNRGWVTVGEVAPAYVFTEQAHARLDPIFNPERYLLLNAHTWDIAEDSPKRGTERKTLFTFNISNSTDYWMDQVVVRITFLDKDGRTVANRDVQVADPIPPRGKAEIDNVEVMVDIAAVPNSRVRIVGARAHEKTPPNAPGAPATEGAPEGGAGGGAVGEVVMGDPADG